MIIATRFPLLDAGYGVDPDGWRIASAAERIATTHKYSASRLPGYPLHELICSIIPFHTPFALNLGSAIASAFAAGFLFLILIEFGRLRALLASLAFAFTPAVFIASVTTIDYIWAVAFVLASLLALLKQKLYWSGALLGLAIGFRITSALFLLPLALAGLQREQSRNVLMKLFGSAMLVGMAAYIPVWNRYGVGFLTFSQYEYPTVSVLIKRLTLDVWGITGLVGVSLLMFRLLVSASVRTGFFRHRTLATVSLTAIMVQFAMFLTLPAEAGYLVPAVPFVVILGCNALLKGEFALFATLVAASSLTLGIDAADRPWSPRPSAVASSSQIGGREIFVDVLKGPVVLDHERRIGQRKFADEIIAFARSQDRASVLVVGSWQPMVGWISNLGMRYEEDTGYTIHVGKTSVVGLLRKSEVDSIRQQGEPIFFIPGQERYNRSVHGLDLQEAGAKPFQVGPK